MYNNTHHYTYPLSPSSLPPPPIPIQHQQQLYYYPISHHHHHSAPPPQTLHQFYYIPTYQQQYRQHRRQQRHSFSRNSNTYQQYPSYNHSNNTNQARRSLSETRRISDNCHGINDTTPKSMTSDNIQAKNKKPPFNILHSMKLAADWIAKTFCFCFTDDSINVIEFNDTYTQQQLKKIP